MLLIEMLGRRFEGTGVDATVVVIDEARGKVRLHDASGDQFWTSLDAFRQAYERGDIIEAAKAPFVLDSFAVKRAALRRYVAGTNKRPNPWIGVLR